MEDWQGCLSPSCQLALVNARQSVENRSGCAITAEDFLLALLDAEPRLLTTLKAHGVEQDELIRTIQCEQPIVSTLAGEGLLSSQLVYWFALARERTEAAWLDWPLLMKVLVQGAERLQGKAYVAVLEQVGDWGPDVSGVGNLVSASASATISPVVVTDTDWLYLAQDMVVAMMASPQSVFWLSGNRGTGKTSWLHSLLPMLPWGHICVDLRRETEVMASRDPLMPVCGSGETPALILDSISPGQLADFLDRDGHLARELVPDFPGPVLLLGHSTGNDGQACEDLACRLGRPVEHYCLPGVTARQLLAVAVAHQSRIEKRWQVELSPGAVKCAARLAAWNELGPGRMLAQLERAAVRVVLYAEQGPLESLSIADEERSLRRQLLVAMARHHELGTLEHALQELSLQRAASEVGWHERKAAGNLRRVLMDDVVAEMARSLAAVQPGSVTTQLALVKPAAGHEPMTG
ncbi:hypothetical protein [Marinobacter mobilis]|uniref:Clp amino terminal domain-containing protein, pathogenicity island component n=1 Tax=Marinobacter mobilis TaxID=488533 RepID=A0A1H2YPJ4_9GAMM|nr:hypothetical protein [Marinobacter mobilis]SDX06748.1 hypothetical protein SAMN04487960_10611 [Marinobacter mobilis]